MAVNDLLVFVVKLQTLRWTSVSVTHPPPHCVLLQVREEEVRIDATIGPVEESFALLNKHELLFNDGNAERVDGLMYAWKNLNALVRPSSC